MALPEEREKHTHNRDTKSTKLERLLSARLIHHDPESHETRHEKASKIIRTQAY
jgi:hypothetical protein